MSGAAYWEERDQAKKSALKMAANLSAREKGTVVLGVDRGMRDEARHDKTRQRKFERGFLSLDVPDEDGDMRDCGDGGRAMCAMIRTIDAEINEFLRELRFAAALDALDGHPELQRTLTAIRDHYRPRRQQIAVPNHQLGGRQQIAAALGISVATYAKRFTRICQILAPLLA